MTLTDSEALARHREAYGWAPDEEGGYDATEGASYAEAVRRILAARRWEEAVEARNEVWGPPNSEGDLLDLATLRRTVLIEATEWHATSQPPPEEGLYLVGRDGETRVAGYDERVWWWVDGGSPIHPDDLARCWWAYRPRAPQHSPGEEPRGAN